MKDTAKLDLTLSELYLIARKFMCDRTSTYIPETDEWADPQDINSKISKAINDYYKVRSVRIAHK